MQKYVIPAEAGICMMSWFPRSFGLALQHTECTPNCHDCVLRDDVFRRDFLANRNDAKILKLISKGLPSTHLNEALRRISIEGAVIGGLRFDKLILIGWLAVCFLLSTKFFRWK